MKTPNNFIHPQDQYFVNQQNKKNYDENAIEQS